MIQPELEQFRGEVERLAAKIAAPARSLPTYGHTEDSARPHIEFAGGQYHFVIVERGQELRRESSANMDDVLYHVFESVTFEMASKYEGAHRRRSEDSRRQLFENQLELIGKLSPTWQQRTRARLEEVLHNHPFVDR